jgi:hypothetical protein
MICLNQNNLTSGMMQEILELATWTTWMCSYVSPKSQQLEEEVSLNHTLDSGLEFLNLDDLSILAFI